MRVPTITIYKQATYQLGRLTADLNKANEVVSENLRISTASDDPSGMVQVLDINSTLSSLDQYQANIDQGLNVLTSAETALDSMADLVQELNLLCSELANASASTQERTDAAENMQTYLDQLIDLANTEAYGGYVFAGDQNQTAPFVFDDADNAAGVTYSGSVDAIAIKASQNTTVSIECCGSDLFYEDEIIVDASNNSIVFEEDPGTGTGDIRVIEATISSGTYTREELAKALENAMVEASSEAGYSLGYEVSHDERANTFSIGTDGTSDAGMTTTLTIEQTETARISNLNISDDYPDAEIEILNESVLTEYTPEPEGSAPLTLTYSTENDAWTVENDPGYGLMSDIEGNGKMIALDLDDDGSADISIDLGALPEDGATVSFDIVEGYENNSILPDLGFDSETVTISPVRSSFEVAETFTVIAGENDTIDFSETLAGENSSSGQLTAVIEAGTYADETSYARAVEDALETASAENGNRVNYEVVYDSDNQIFTIREDADTGLQLASFDLLFSSGTNKDSSAASDLGFNSKDLYSGSVKGEMATWSIFDTLFDLEEALAENDVDGIQRAMTRLENHYENLTSSIASVGMIYSGLTALESTATEAETTLEVQLSDVRDADSVEAINRLNTIETVYEAALSSCASIMGLSLADYM